MGDLRRAIVRLHDESSRSRLLPSPDQIAGRRSTSVGSQSLFQKSSGPCSLMNCRSTSWTFVSRNPNADAQVVVSVEDHRREHAECRHLRLGHDSLAEVDGCRCDGVAYEVVAKAVTLPRRRAGRGSRRTGRRIRSRSTRRARRPNDAPRCERARKTSSDPPAASRAPAAGAPAEGRARDVDVAVQQSFDVGRVHADVVQDAAGPGAGVGGDDCEQLRRGHGDRAQVGVRSVASCSAANRAAWASAEKTLVPVRSGSAG